MSNSHNSCGRAASANVNTNSMKSPNCRAPNCTHCVWRCVDSNGHCTHKECANYAQSRSLSLTHKPHVICPAYYLFRAVSALLELRVWALHSKVFSLFTHLPHCDCGEKLRSPRSDGFWIDATSAN